MNAFPPSSACQFLVSLFFLSSSLFPFPYRPFYRATRTHSADYAMARCLSVCLSVRPSDTRRYCVDTITHILKVFSSSGSPTILCRGSKKLAARQCWQCGPNQTGSDVVEKMCTRELQSWRDSVAANWMPSKLKPHRHRRTLSRRGRQNLRVGKTRRSECRPRRHEE